MDLVGKVVACAHSGQCQHNCSTAFKIVPQEIDFYSRFRLPLPDLCPNCRYGERLRFRNPVQLWSRTCQCAGATSDNGVYANTANHTHTPNHCPNELETSYSPDRPEIIYCEQCYQAEVA
ncbi:MAG: hypothetical protein HY978_04940 [Candidatus Liptonbacteria bacterium]|nr:hypothetical protein [Candidatus Liptonbacteria bacterium]